MRIWHKNIDGVHAFYVNGLLRALYMSLTTIFVPLLVYGLGASRWGSVAAGIALVLAYFALQRVVVTVIVFPLSKMIERMGFRKSISWSVIFLIGYTGALMLAQHQLNWLWVSAVCGGIQIPKYWISRDSALTQDVPGKKMGSKLGYIVVLENIAGLLGPFAGGAIVAFFGGYTALFIVSLVILGLSTISLWWMPPHSHKNGVSLAGFFQFLQNKRYLHQTVANIGCAMNDYGNGVIWPLVLFLQGIKSEKLGIIYSLVAVMTIVVQGISGKWFDKLRGRNDYADEGVYGLASIGVGLSWLVRIFAIGLSRVLLVDIGRQLFGSIHDNFYSDYLHLGGKRMGSIAYWVYLEVVYSLGSLFIFGVMGVGLYFGIWKELTLVTIALWSLATIVIARESNMR